jgi:signal transduction histidine kinase
MTSLRLADLQSVPLLQGLNGEQLQFLLDHGTGICLEAGQRLFKVGDQVDEMLLVLEGELQLLISIGGQLFDTTHLTKGGLTGRIPFSRMKESQGELWALKPSTLLALHRTHFGELERVAPNLMERLVGKMTDRVREITAVQQQHERMAALGRLAAGLAHELNNPAAAILRTADGLCRLLHQLPELVADTSPLLMETKLPLLYSHIAEAAPAGPQSQESMLERSERESALVAWLEEQGVEDGFDLGKVFLDKGWAIAELENLQAQVAATNFRVALAWLNYTFNVVNRVKEIQDAAGHIVSLVNSVKSYSHLDRAGGMEPISVQAGIANTLKILGHRLHEKNISLHLDFQPHLAPVKGNAGELNQVWTNLLDNALDALAPNGELRISAKAEGEGVQIRIQDNGTGISPEHLDRIFEPFFTTKAVGQGTGLGLDIVKRILDLHQATIQVTSEPGKTEFVVTFPPAEGVILN